MTTRGELDRQLGSWFETEATADGAASLLEATLNTTARLRPRPAWVAGLDDARPARLLPIDRRTRSRLGYAALVAATIAALVAGALFLAGQRPPRPSLPLGCVGEPANLCGHTAGLWSTSTFLPGMTLTFPSDAWYTRESTRGLEVKALPMVADVLFALDPVPAALPGAPSPSTVPSGAELATWLERVPGVRIDRFEAHATQTGLPVTTLDVSAVRPPGGFPLLVDPAGTVNHGYVLEASHYVQRAHLVDIGGGHVLLVVVVAYDSSHDTVVAADRAFAPILDSLGPPSDVGP